MAANIARTPAEAKLIIIGVLNLLGAVTDDADDIRRDSFDLDAMATIRRSGAVNVVGIFFLRQYFLNHPAELEDAGRVDGWSGTRTRTGSWTGTARTR